MTFGRRAARQERWARGGSHDQDFRDAVEGGDETIGRQVQELVHASRDNGKLHPILAHALVGPVPFFSERTCGALRG